MTVKMDNASSPLRRMHPGGADRPYRASSISIYADVLPRMMELLGEAKCHRTRATISEVCINHIRGKCQRAGSCSRIHPVDKTQFLKILRERAKNSQRQRQKTSQEPVPLIQNSDVPLFESSVEHTVSLAKFSQSITGSVTDQESRIEDSELKETISGGSWDSETGCWVMPCNLESWTCEPSSHRFQGISRGSISEGWWLEDAGRLEKESTSFQKCVKWLQKVRESCEESSPMIGVEKGRHGPPCHPVRCRLWIGGKCDRGSACEYPREMSNTRVPGLA